MDNCVIINRPSFSSHSYNRCTTAQLPPRHASHHRPKRLGSRPGSEASISCSYGPGGRTPKVRYRGGGTLAAAAHHLAEEMQHTPQQNAKLSDPKKFAWPDYSALEAANIFASIAQRSRTELNPAAESSLFQEPKKQSNEEAGKEPKPHGQKREMRKIS